MRGDEVVVAGEGTRVRCANVEHFARGRGRLESCPLGTAAAGL